MNIFLMPPTGQTEMCEPDEGSLQGSVSKIQPNQSPFRTKDE